MTEPPVSRAIERLSPTSYEVLRECPLRFSYRQHPSSGAQAGTPASRLGTVCHNVLDRAVREGSLQEEGWRDAVQRLWDEELSAEVAAANDPDLDDPKRWPGYQLKRARLLQVAGRVREFLDGLPADAEVLTEQSLTADGGLLYGRADLVIRGTERHQIIDYKSGAVVDRDTQLPRAAYVRQLQLYAYLEHASSGSWPSTAHLFPLHGAPVEISVEPSECILLASDALMALHDYNAAVPAHQPARPSPEHCKWCPAAAACAAFWAACNETWAPSIWAVSGMVTNAFATELGGATIHIDQRAGSLMASGAVVIKNIDPELFADGIRLSPGDEVAATGLVPDERGAGYWLGPAGAVAVRRAAFDRRARMPNGVQVRPPRGGEL